MIIFWEMVPIKSIILKTIYSFMKDLKYKRYCKEMMLPVEEILHGVKQRKTETPNLQYVN